MSTCLYCSGPVGEADISKKNYAQCFDCLTPFHFACYIENDQRCTTMACACTGVHRTPQPTTLPAKRELTDIVENEEKTAISHFIEQEDKLDKILSEYRWRKGTFNAGIKETLESAYLYSETTITKDMCTTAKEFLTEYDALQQKEETFKEELNALRNEIGAMKNKYEYMGIWSAMLNSAFVVSCITWNVPLMLAAGGLDLVYYYIINSLSDKKEIGLKTIIEQKKQYFEQKKDKSIKDLKQQFAQKLYLAEQKKERK